MIAWLLQMGTADAILDLVSSGTTLRENNLKQIDGGLVLESQVRFCFPMNFLFLLYLWRETLEKKAIWWIFYRVF